MQPTISLNQLLQQWSEFVVEVERGYADSIYEYTNDLSARDLLDEILGKARDPLREQLVELVEPWDDRFMKATREINRPLPIGLSKEAGPRWFRIPKNLIGELESDLRSVGGNP